MSKRKKDKKNARDVDVSHLIAGTRLPDLALPATEGADVNLARFQERAVVFVFPFTGEPGKPNPPGWDDIPGAHGSTPEAEGFRDHYSDFRQLGWDVFGLSGQSSKDQKEFAQRAGLPFVLLSDAKHDFTEALGLPTFSAGSKDYLTRLTLLVRDGVIYRVCHPIENPAGHAQEILADLNAASV